MSSTPSPPPFARGERSARWGALLTLGIGTTVGMWAAAYVCQLPRVAAPTEALVGIFLVCLLGGGFFSGRWSAPVGPGGRFLAGARVGALASLLNLLILGSALADRPETAWAWIPGTILLGALLAGVGALLAHALGPAAAPPRNWSSGLARVTAAATLLLLGVGGLVTTKGVGLAVPDWPNSFTSNMFFFPLSQMTGGVYYEHAHRLFGSLVGLTTLALAVYVAWVDPRAWVRRLAGSLFVLVVVQGVLGGLRVTGRLTLSAAPEDLAPRDDLALVHGVLGQVFFGLLVALAAFVSTAWRRLEEEPPGGLAQERGAEPATDPEAGETTRTLATWLLGLTLAQLVLGALVRHTGMSVSLHITVGLAILVLAGVVGFRAWGLHGRSAALAPAGIALIAVTTLQFLLGMTAFAVTAAARGDGAAGLLAAYRVPVATIHQTCGALVLALVVLVRVWAAWLPAAPAAALPDGAAAPAGDGAERANAAAAPGPARAEG